MISESFLILYKNNKTGNHYFGFTNLVINANNNQVNNNIEMKLYIRVNSPTILNICHVFDKLIKSIAMLLNTNEFIFVRDTKEFDEKFSQ